MRRFRIRVVALAALAAALSLCQCAKFPSGGGANFGKRLTFSVTFAADMHLSTDNAYYYFILIDADNNAQDGPLPVISPPWGNGFAAGHYTHFVSVGRFNADRAAGALTDCVLWSMLDPGHDLTLMKPVRVVSTSTVSGPTITFEIYTSDLGIDLTTAGTYVPVQINFIATDRIPVAPNDLDKHWDSLGDGGLGQYTSYLNLNITENGTHDNGGLEPTGDVEPGPYPEPALDIKDFSITVRS
jgi:hypothetical protein